jgi:gliding motility-associated-like protein
MDTIKLVSQKHSSGLTEDADMIIGRLDPTNTWLWARHLDGGFGGIGTNRTSATSSLNSNKDLIVIASTLEDVYVDPNGMNRRILSQTKGNTAFSMRVSPNGEISCGNPLMIMDTIDPHLIVTGLEILDSNKYFWYGTYWDDMELFDGTEIIAGSAASYMIDASFCPEYPCASIESTTCGDTLRACTWSTTSWQWFKDGIHLPESDGDSLLHISDNGTYMLVAYLDDDCPYQRPDTTSLVVDHFTRFDLVVEPVNCKWGENGAVQVIPYAGSGPFGYSLDGINFDTISSFTGLNPGDYEVFVNSEAHGCIYSDSFSITTLELTHLKDTRCYGDTLSIGNYTFYEGIIDTLLFLDNILHPGCDSTIRLEVQFKDPVQVISDQSYVCDSALSMIDTLITPYYDYEICDSVVLISQKILAPSWYIDTTLFICQGDSISINGVWYLQSAFVEAQMVSSFGCDSILLVDLQVIEPPVFEEFKDTFVASGTTLTLEAPFQNGYIYNWQPPDNLSCQNCPAPQILAEEDQSLTLFFTDSHGCFSHTVQYDIKVYAEEIAVPNMFTPNGDGVNDLFGVIVVKGPPESIKIHNFSIFNRWGKQIFNSQDVLNAWDGLHSGEPCPMDNYGWVLDVEFANGKREVLRGHVTLVR